MVKLSELLRRLGVGLPEGVEDQKINKITSDSREVEPNSLFVAIDGVAVDGHKYVKGAIERGAVVAVVEKEIEDVKSAVKVADSREALGLLASEFYGNPSDKLKLVGVTGTNGKTTIATVLYELFVSLGYCSGLLSTICNKIGDKTVVSTHTTPDPVQLNRLLADMVDGGVDFCFMEVSSHAVDQRRIAGLNFDGAVFTNLTHDHLDYHKTFASYRDAKKGFFDKLSKDSFAISNGDDSNGKIMLQNCKAKHLYYALKRGADIKSKVLEKHMDGTLVDIDGSELWTQLVGEFNIYNLSAVYAVALELGVERDQLLPKLSELMPVDGRFQLYKSPKGVYGVVDYAHTPDALKNVLAGIKDVTDSSQSIITVVGAGGDRDKTKRPEMAQEALAQSNRVILTSDNPRTESPDAILDDMMSGVSLDKRGMVLRISDRKEAIRTAVMLALPGDVILVAGKGHEDYQEINGVKHHFDDREVITNEFELN